MTLDLRAAVVDLWSTHLPERWVRERARELGVVKRIGKVDPYALMMYVQRKGLARTALKCSMKSTRR